MVNPPYRLYIGIGTIGVVLELVLVLGFPLSLYLTIFAFAHVLSATITFIPLSVTVSNATYSIRTVVRIIDILLANSLHYYFLLPLHLCILFHPRPFSFFLHLSCSCIPSSFHLYFMSFLPPFFFSFFIRFSTFISPLLLCVPSSSTVLSAILVYLACFSFILSFTSLTDDLFPALWVKNRSFPPFPWVQYLPVFFFQLLFSCSFCTYLPSLPPLSLFVPIGFSSD
uniref:Uncharacterized protein n=1 Tax=Cacopsylla melanoneura TaxID=428564 RepID=A0A8D8ZAV5_9HEMI